MIRTCYWCNGRCEVYYPLLGLYGTWLECEVCHGTGEIDDPDLEPDLDDDEDWTDPMGNPLPDLDDKEGDA